MQAFEVARGRADSPVSVMDVALDAQLGGTGDLLGVVMGGACVDLGGSKTSQSCSKRSLRQIQNGDSKHVWGVCRAHSMYREGCVENARQMVEPSEHPGTSVPAPALPLKAALHKSLAGHLCPLVK